MLKERLFYKHSPAVYIAAWLAEEGYDVVLSGFGSEWGDKEFSAHHPHPLVVGEVTITSSADKLVEFIEKLYERNVPLKTVMKSVYLRFSGGPSTISLSKTFAEDISVKGYFRWVDKAQGIYSSEFRYNPSRLYAWGK